MTDTTTPGTHIEVELASQPECWAHVVATLEDHLAGLPLAEERVAVVGCGTSLYVGRAYAALREASGAGETDAFPASEYRHGRLYDRVVAISRSGATSEIRRPRSSMSSPASAPAIDRRRSWRSLPTVRRRSPPWRMR